jgi:hypothetical protein
VDGIASGQAADARDVAVGEQVGGEVGDVGLVAAEQPAHVGVGDPLRRARTPVP